MSKRTRVTVLVPNLSSNCLGRGYLLARVLSRDYDVEVGGPMTGPRVWPPFDDGRFNYFFIDERDSLDRSLEKISGDVIYASKLLPASFGLALAKKDRDGTPVVLDIDDWELAYALPGRISLAFFIDKVGNFLRPATGFPGRRPPFVPNYLEELLFEKRAKEADAITTASTFLQKRFGGSLLPHGRDTNIFDPRKFDRVGARAKYGLADYRVVMFVGTPRAHKGVEFLVNAVKLCRTENVKLVVAGMNPDARRDDRVFQNRLKAEANGRTLFLDMFPFHELPNYLVMSDLVVLPQAAGGRLPLRDRFFARAQVPAKVFDAMALERPIIATPVSDLPQILDGCGYVVRTENEATLAAKIDDVFANYDEAAELGKKAREKCIKEYSWDAMQVTLRDVFLPFDRRT